VPVAAQLADGRLTFSTDCTAKVQADDDARLTIRFARNRNGSHAPTLIGLGIAIAGRTALPNYKCRPRALHPIPRSMMSVPTARSPTNGSLRIFIGQDLRRRTSALAFGFADAERDGRLHASLQSRAIAENSRSAPRSSVCRVPDISKQIDVAAAKAQSIAIAERLRYRHGVSERSFIGRPSCLLANLSSSRGRIE